MIDSPDRTAYRAAMDGQPVGVRRVACRRVFRLGAVVAAGLTGLTGLVASLAVLAPAPAAAKGSPLCFRICSDNCTTQRGFCNTSGRIAVNVCLQAHDYCMARCHQDCNTRLH